MGYKNRVLWFDETLLNLFGSDGVRHVSCLQSSMVLLLSYSEATWVLLTMQSYILLKGHRYIDIKQRVKLGRRASKTPGTLQKKLKVKMMVMVGPSMSPDQNPVNDLLCTLKQKAEESKFLVDTGVKIIVTFFLLSREVPLLFESDGQSLI